MKNIVYLIFFSILASVLVACGDGKQVANNDDQSDAIEKVEKAEKTESNEKIEEAAKKVVSNSNADEKAVKEPVTPENSGQIALGEKLVKEHCSSCHQAEMYTRAESKIKSADALLKQIKMCDANIGTSLFDEDMEAIATYLDKNFYKFAK